MRRKESILEKIKHKIILFKIRNEIRQNSTIIETTLNGFEDEEQLIKYLRELEQTIINRYCDTVVVNIVELLKDREYVKHIRHFIENELVIERSKYHYILKDIEWYLYN